jgi:hypothetical protein
MEIREFKLINEKGQEYSLMDIENAGLLTSPNGLGFQYENQYEQLGHTFVKSISKISQTKVTGQINFLKYENYRKLVDFIASSEDLKISYKVPYKTGTKEFFKDVSVDILNKGEKTQNGVLSENITFNSLSLWYEQTKTVYEVGNTDNELRWDFKWDSKFAGYDVRRVQYINQGHVDASIELTIEGTVLNPKIDLLIDKEVYQTVEINTTIDEYEKLLYSSKETDFYIKKQLADGTSESIYDLETINFANDNVIRIPKNKNAEIRLRADNDITRAILTIYTYYIAV